ncbi:MAG: GntR family transcriptional regulator [Proteobacteria bacterium]|nr:GntR family transcriptional regulator [Desulfobulbaceae bacterium]MBU4154135.1 GntR family transcriptional regulator [Pseudomonadota bacterium]MDP2106677.1 GntR family transcriptional regulator [Desulfobulbaceae bacterium]
MRLTKAIDRDRPKKLHVQVLEALRDEIENGKWQIGAQIPIEDELCREFNVSKAVIRQAILDLVRQGYLIRHQGKGTFVCKKSPPPGVTMSTSFEELMLEDAASFSCKILAQTAMTPLDHIEEKLGSESGHHVIYIKRLLSVGTDPALLAESYIPYRTCPELLREDLTDKNIVEVVEKKYKTPITKIRIFIDAEIANDSEAELLDLDKGSMVMALEQHFYSGTTRVMYMRIIKRTDKARFFREFDKN